MVLLQSYIGCFAPLLTIVLASSKPSQVSITTLSMTDPSRSNPSFASSNNTQRSIMVSAYSPANCHKTQDTDYMPAALAKHYDQKILAPFGFSDKSFSSIKLQTCDNAGKSRSCSPKDKPTVLVFSPALGTSRLLYGEMLRDIASTGYHVISIDHPYDADLVVFPDGTSIAGADISDEQLDIALATRVADISFVVKKLQDRSIANSLLPGVPAAQLKNSNIATIGHSFGGAAAIEALLEIPSLRGALNLDGSTFGASIKPNTRIEKPVFFVGHENKTRAADPSWEATWANLKTWKSAIEVKKTAHYTFSDLPLIASKLQIEGLVPQMAEMIGSLTGPYAMDLSTDTIVGFFDFVLKNKGEKTLKKATSNYPEIKYVN